VFRPRGSSRPDTSAWSGLVEYLKLDSVEQKLPTSCQNERGLFVLAPVHQAGDDSLKVLFEPFEDRFHRFIGPFPIHVEVDTVF